MHHRRSESRGSGPNDLALGSHTIVTSMTARKSTWPSSLREAVGVDALGIDAGLGRELAYHSFGERHVVVPAAQTRRTGVPASADCVEVRDDEAVLVGLMIEARVRLCLFSVPAVPVVLEHERYGDLPCVALGNVEQVATLLASNGDRLLAIAGGQNRASGAGGSTAAAGSTTKPAQTGRAARPTTETADTTLATLAAHVANSAGTGLTDAA